MKQSVFYKNLNRLFSRLDRGRPYVLDGFHPDFFLSIYRSVNCPTMLVLPDRVFDSSLKYLSCLLENEHVVFGYKGLAESMGYRRSSGCAQK